MVKRFLLILSFIFLLCCFSSISSFPAEDNSSRLPSGNESSFPSDVVLEPDESDTEASPESNMDSNASTPSSSKDPESDSSSSAMDSSIDSLPDSIAESAKDPALSNSSTSTESDPSSDTESVPTPSTPPSELPSDPIERPVTSVEELVDSLSIEELVGQMFLARCPRSESGAIRDLQTYHLGGYILFGSNFENQTPTSIRTALQQYQNLSPIPMFFAVDEEGGTVVRVSRFSAFRSSAFLSPRDLYAEGGLEAIRATEREKAGLLHSLGLNVNMAPVCDITTSSDSFMYERSLGQSPEITAAFVKNTIDDMHASQVGSVLKHFPGYGNNTDTHVGIAIDNRSLSELLSYDLIPFQAGIDGGCDAILVSHTFITDIDPDLPATLSPAVHQVLRNQMGFEGVIVTDDLAMGAITSLYGSGEAAVLAVQAGNDLLCSTDYAVQYNAVLEAVYNGRISSDSIRVSVLRLLRWKQTLGLL